MTHSFCIRSLQRNLVTNQCTCTQNHLQFNTSKVAVMLVLLVERRTEQELCQGLLLRLIMLLYPIVVTAKNLGLIMDNTLETIIN